MPKGKECHGGIVEVRQRLLEVTYEILCVVDLEVENFDIVDEPGYLAPSLGVVADCGSPYPLQLILILTGLRGIDQISDGLQQFRPLGFQFRDLELDNFDENGITISRRTEK